MKRIFNFNLKNMPVQKEAKNEEDMLMSEPTKQPAESVNKNNSKSNKNALLAIGGVVVLIVIASAIIFFTGGMNKISDKIQPGGENATQSQDETNNKTVAVVDGQEITQADVDNRTGLIIAGFNVPANQVTNDQKLQARQIALQQLINEMLILKAAESSGITVSSDQIQSELDKIIGNFPDEQSFKQALATNKVTVDDLKNDISRRLVIQKYIDANTDSSSIEVTDDEVGQLYDQYAANQENMPDIEEIRSQLEQQIFQQKLNQQIDALIKKLQDAADITIFN